MGVTIHFEGKLKSENDYALLIQNAKSFADRNKYEYFEIKEENKLLQRVREEEDWDYQGMTKGIQIQPTENSEPFILEFDRDLYIQEYCKTQFAEVEVHIELIAFLEEIQTYFSILDIIDEGEYLDTKDREILTEHINNCWNIIEKYKSENPNSVGPYRTESGRIIDYSEIDN